MVEHGKMIYANSAYSTWECYHNASFNRAVICIIINKYPYLWTMERVNILMVYENFLCTKPDCMANAQVIKSEI